MNERLICEPIQPLLSEDPVGPVVSGEPLLPTRFMWRDEEVVVAEVLERWKELSPGTVAMPDRYLRKHWFRIRTSGRREMKIYFERKARSRAGAKQRWWIFSLLDVGRSGESNS